MAVGAHLGLWDKLKSLIGGAPPADAAPPVAPTTPPTAAAPAPDPFSLGKMLELGPDELHAAAAKASWSLWSEWRWRRDVIPPLSDARTAVLDRAIVLRGLATQEELTQLHKIGDEHLLASKDNVALGAVVSAGGEAAVQTLRADKAKRKAEKQRAAQEKREQRRRDVEARKRSDIIFLGRGVSGRLHERTPKGELRAGLPALRTPQDIARALGLTIPQLRGLCFHADAAARVHYVQFDVPKKTGGTRRLAAPLPRLAAAQQWVQREILAKVPVGERAHGFVKARSTVTNAAPHQRKDLVVNVDLENFFPTITFPRVRGLFESLGYSPCAATVLALLCTECPRVVVEHRGKKLHVAVGDRALPQGACTSPALSNLVCAKLDKRIQGIAAGSGLAYTRYADDITLSGPALSKQKLAHLIASVDEICVSEGFRVNAQKTRVMRKSTRQEVTGVVVNSALPRVPRDEMRRLRAILHDAGKFGLDEANREKRPDFPRWLRGKLAYVAMVDPVRGQALLEQLDDIEAR